MFTRPMFAGRAVDLRYAPMLRRPTLPRKLRPWAIPKLSTAITTISSSELAPPAACWPTGFRPIRASACSCWRPGAATTGSGTTSRWDTCSQFSIHVRTGCSRPSPRKASTVCSLNYPRGKVIGGSSSINAMIYMRGQAADYDHWRQLGLTGWGSDDVLPFFRRHEDHFLGPSEAHAVGGELRIEAPRVRWDILDAFCAAAEQAGIKRIPDFNTGDNEGSCVFHVNQKRGRRWSAARGFLKPVLNRANLRLETDCLAESIAFNGTRAAGVRWRQNGAPRSARARGEVILAAGSICSIQILKLSGVGGAEELPRLGIPVVLDKPGVGNNLPDHLQLRLIYKIAGAKTLNEAYHSLIGRARMGLDYALFRRGPLTMAPSQLGLYTRSDPGRERANLQFHVQPLSLDKFGDPLHEFGALTASVCNLQPTSRGSVRLRSADAADKPVIKPNYLSTDEDRRVAADSIRLT